MQPQLRRRSDFLQTKPCVVIDLVDLSTRRVENVKLIVGRGGEGDETTQAFLFDFIDPSQEPSISFYR
jgi:hypothetical protein